MPELPPVSPGEFIASAHINDIALRSIQRYQDEATLAAENPTPTDGELAFVASTAAFGNNQIFVFQNAAWFLVIRGDAAGNINIGSRNFLTASPGIFNGPGAIRHTFLDTFTASVTPNTKTDSVRALSGFNDVTKMVFTAIGAAGNQQSQRSIQSINNFSTSSVTVTTWASTDMSAGGTATIRLHVVEYY